MTSTTKAKNQLLDTMRMSKSGVDEAPAQQAVAKTEASAPAATTRKKTAAASRTKKAAAKKTTAKKTSAAKKSPTAGITRDAFQAAPRIWPD